MRIDEIQKGELQIIDQLQGMTMNSLHMAFHIIFNEVGKYRVKQWLEELQYL